MFNYNMNVNIIKNDKHNHFHITRAVPSGCATHANYMGGWRQPPKYKPPDKQVDLKIYFKVNSFCYYVLWNRCIIGIVMTLK